MLLSAYPLALLLCPLAASAIITTANNDDDDPLAPVYAYCARKWKVHCDPPVFEAILKAEALRLNRAPAEHARRCMDSALSLANVSAAARFEADKEMNMASFLSQRFADRDQMLAFAAARLPLTSALVGGKGAELQKLIKEAGNDPKAQAFFENMATILGEQIVATSKNFDYKQHIRLIEDGTAVLHKMLSAYEALPEADADAVERVLCVRTALRLARASIRHPDIFIENALSDGIFESLFMTPRAPNVQ